MVGLGRGYIPAQDESTKSQNQRKLCPRQKKKIYEDDGDDDAVSMYSPCVMSTRKNMRGYIYIYQEKDRGGGGDGDERHGDGATWEFIT